MWGPVQTINRGLASLLLFVAPIWSQAVPAPPAPAPVALSPDLIKAIQDALTKASAPAPVVIPLPAPTMLPTTFVSGGGGFASPSGKFAYASISTLALPQQTYATGVVEYTLVKGQVETCTFGGVSKPMYQVSFITAGLTGLGGGCNSTNGNSAVAGSGQIFLYFRWGKLPLGNVLTFMKNTNSGFKVTLGFSLSKD